MDTNGFIKNIGIAQSVMKWHVLSLSCRESGPRSPNFFHMPIDQCLHYQKHN